MSMGFPATKGGLIFWADLIGAKYIENRLSELSAKMGPKLGGFFKPCDYLVQAARSGRKLGAGVIDKANSKL